VQGVYSSALMKAIGEPWKGREYGPKAWASREEAEQQAAYWQAHPLSAHDVDGSFLTGVSDPPPLDLEPQGRSYYLAQFNAYRAISSAALPPREV
jgi:hypothetical protein